MKRRRATVPAVLAVAASLLAFASLALEPSAAADALRAHVAQLQQTGELIDGNPIANAKDLAELYARRDYEAAWTRRQIGEWIDWLGRIDAEGLNPADYDVERLEQRFRTNAADTDAAAQLELLATASWLLAAHDLRFGKVDPKTLERSWNLERERVADWDPVAMLDAALDAPSMARFLAAQFPRPPLYDALKEALGEYHDIEARGGWPRIPRGPTLQNGDRGERVERLRRRLTITGDYWGSESEEPIETFGPELEAAVRSFQERHGLTVDGIVGPATLAALNVPVSTRIDQIRLNLERGRWVLDSLSERFLVVNIASFQIFLVENGHAVWAARTQVGRDYRETPVFRSELEHVVLNPTWTIPPRILREDIVPMMRRDPTYLSRLGIDVVTTDGQPVDAAAIDWTRLTAPESPYLLRQRPGPENPLGRLKFVFPNEHFVFLHDTPSQVLFSEPQRAFSSGCIRVEQAITLAELVLDDPSHWSRERLGEAIATGETVTLPLRRPVPVLVLYWTVSVDGFGRVRFLPDIYARDTRVLEALDRRASAARSRRE